MRFVAYHMCSDVTATAVPADQALTTWVLWFWSLCAFLPVIFTNLMVWLRSEEDADDALRRLVRGERH